MGQVANLPHKKSGSGSPEGPPLPKVTALGLVDLKLSAAGDVYFIVSRPNILFGSAYRPEYQKYSGNGTENKKGRRMPEWPRLPQIHLVCRTRT
jgi:hypothetical protein